MIDWSAPDAPGVYLFRDAGGRIVYVGKANSLADRLSHYRAASLEPKTSELMSVADSLEVIACRNETEALVLENTLIKQHRPKYNVLLKDTVQYAYLKVTNEEFPRILTTRLKKVARGEKLLGPFVSGESRTVALREVTRTFGLRICNPLPGQACLQYRLGFCSGPCIGKISVEEYGENVKAAVDVLCGHTQEVEGRLQGEIGAASGRQDYERALVLRNRLNALSRLKQKQLMEGGTLGNEDFFGFVRHGEKLRACVLKSRSGVILGRDSFEVSAIGESPQAEFILRYYDEKPLPHKVYARLEEAEAAAVAELLSGQQAQFVVPKRGDKLELVGLAEKNAALASGVAGSSQEAIAVQKALGLSRPPAAIDCFDASNLAGKQLVGSCVRLVDGKPEKSSYRRFKVKTTGGMQDDFASIKEIVYRRYRGALEKNERLPDLVLVDGGIGQLHSAMEALGELSLELPIASLAKREEEIYLPDLMKPLSLAKSSAGLKLLMRARDEAHRFALAYNRKRRKMESGY